MGKKFLITVLLLWISGLLTAHEFWLEPARFYFQPGESASVSFKVGESFLGDLWKVKTDRIIRIEHYAPSDVRNLKRMLNEDTTDPFEMRLTTEGTHVVVMESDAAYTSVAGTTFTEYLEEYALDEVLYQREKTGIAEDSAAELYSRHTKLILQSGSRSDDTYKKNFNMPIEIVPDKNPVSMKKGDRIGFRILFQGKPLFGARVKVFNRYNHRTSVQNIFSQQDGMIETHVSNPGSWMVSVVKMIPSQDKRAPYRSYWGTLVFGVR